MSWEREWRATHLGTQILEPDCQGSNHASITHLVLKHTCSITSLSYTIMYRIYILCYNILVLYNNVLVLYYNVLYPILWCPYLILSHTVSYIIMSLLYTVMYTMMSLFYTIMYYILYYNVLILYYSILILCCNVLILYYHVLYPNVLNFSSPHFHSSP